MAPLVTGLRPRHLAATTGGDESTVERLRGRAEQHPPGTGGVAPLVSGSRSRRPCAALTPANGWPADPPGRGGVAPPVGGSRSRRPNALPKDYVTKVTAVKPRGTWQPLYDVYVLSNVVV